ncbi:hypothetical protein LJ655_15905 [Paraburkholderia sp. MMS20-SJTN17]|uniref:Uncharacterized protein n=1 Tax=Paraburkholderia translucens TaxID=2886945 RepID=A0ABS8KF03_9BURK|nr:hypothetical protein [Paraburkholderia sp. MMS20-SJTN17]MCC8403356.1 hypothetical protein [Paraburkholderia sp. MMS20-SJTN17]
MDELFPVDETRQARVLFCTYLEHGRFIQKGWLVALSFSLYAWLQTSAAPCR